MLQWRKSPWRHRLMAQSDSHLLALRRVTRRICTTTVQDCRWFGNPRLLEAKTLATIEIATAAER
jgi:hypothetical protein